MGKIVEYVGTSDVRRITKADWKQRGFDGPTVEFSVENNFRLPADDMPAEVLDYFDKEDIGFKVVDSEAEPDRVNLRRGATQEASQKDTGAAGVGSTVGSGGTAPVTTTGGSTTGR